MGAGAAGFGAGAAGFAATTGFGATTTGFAAGALAAAGFRAGALRAAGFFAAVLRAAGLRAALLRAGAFFLALVFLAAVLRALAAFLAVALPVLRTVRAALRAVLRTVRAVFRAPLRAPALLAVRFFLLVFVAMASAPILPYCRTRPLKRTRTCANQRFHLVQACRPTWRVNRFFLLYADRNADRDRKWQGGASLSASVIREFSASDAAEPALCRLVSSCRKSPRESPRSPCDGGNPDRRSAP